MTSFINMDNEDTRSNDENTFRILVATDCHLGYQEKDAIRGNDSMVTFEEILSIAKKRAVDFILLAGDLFHVNKPSRKTLHSTMHLLRKYCFGDKPVPFQFVSRPSDNFKHCSFSEVNYEDPNYNVAIPVFSIHGNHDDPSGDGNLCSLDILSVSGLVNYFGKCSDSETIKLTPILLQKGTTRIALYGLGSMKDERLHRIMRNHQASFLCPAEEPSSWFNIMAIHQNRVKHGATNYIPEEFLDDFLDLVIWGHEHECRIEPEYNNRQQFFVSQPGSSVATSMCHGEAVPKHVGLLEIHQKEFRMIKIPLQTVRPMYVEDIDLTKCKINYDFKIEENVMEFCKEKMERILELAEREHTGHDKQPKKPLVRLRIEHSREDEIFSVPRFGQFYIDKVANPKELVIFRRRRVDKDYKFREIVDDIRERFMEISSDVVETTRVEDVVRDVFEELDESKRLMLLTEEGLGDALTEYVVKDEKLSIKALIKYQLTSVREHLKRRQEAVDEESILNEVLDYKSSSRKSGRNSSLEAKKDIEKLRDNLKEKEIDEISLTDEDANETSVAVSGRGRGQKRGGSSARGRVRGRGRANAASTSNRQALESGKRKKGSPNTIKNMFKNLKPVENEDSDECSIIESDDEVETGNNRFQNLANSRKSTSRGRSNNNNMSGMLRSSRASDVSSSVFMSSSRQSSSQVTRKSTPRKGFVYFDESD